MALPLYVGGYQTERFIEKVFEYLVENLPDHYIVSDQATSAMEVRFASGPKDVVEYGAIVLAPGIAAQIQMWPVGDLVRFDDSDPHETRIAYRREGVHPREEVRMGKPRPYEALQLADVVDWLADAEEVVGSEVSEFFSKVRAVETTVLSWATSEWDEAAACAMGFEQHHTKHSVVKWLQELEDRIVFQDSKWTEERARALFWTLGVNLDGWGWDRTWDTLERYKELQAKQAETLSEQELTELISRHYPFPLAFSLRKFDTEPGYPAKLACAENVLAYLGSLGITLARDAGVSLSSDDGLGRHLRGKWSGGISTGQWTEIVRETTRALHSSCEVTPSLPDFFQVYWKDTRKPHRCEAGDIIESIPEDRNDFYHNRYPTSTDEYEEAGARLREKMSILYRGLRFLEPYPLWYVTDCAMQRGSRLCRVTYRLCTGDNAQFRRLEAEVGQCVYRDSVYLKTPGHLVDLTPWIVMRTCPECGSQAMFFVEKIDSKKKQVTYKSFNRGHIDQSNQYWDIISSQLGLQR